MRKLLLVDDEPILVEGLLEYLRETLDGAELFHAYSAIEALDMMRKVPMDVLITDISMPGMTGIELLLHVRENWPRCKVILLSVFDNFDYAQLAIRNGGFNYVLKTEGDEKILQALEAAFDELNKELQLDDFLAKAAVQRKQALPLMQEGLLRDILTGTKSATNERFASVELGLDEAQRIMMVVGKVDRWHQDLSKSDRSLLLFALHNVAQEHLGLHHLSFHEVRMDSHFCWIIGTHGDKWEETAGIVHSALESIQEASGKLLKVMLSLVSSSSPATWKEAPFKYAYLLRMLRRGFGIGEELLMTDAEDLSGKDVSSKGLLDIQNRLRRIGRLESLFESGQKRELLHHFDEITSEALNTSNVLLIMEVYNCFFYQTLSYMNRWNLTSLYEEDSLLFNSLPSLADRKWAELFGELRKIMERMIDYESNDRAARVDDVVTKIRQYIERNLKNDLSLTKLGEIVYLNPIYLSRLYKQLTGQGLNEYVIEIRLNKAMELLGNPRMKIQEIAEEVGYESASYFTRYFKKAIGLTPVDYREQIALSGRSDGAKVQR